MAAYGARGNTEKQMRTSLRMPENDAVSKSGIQSLIETLNVSILFYYFRKIFHRILMDINI